MKVEKKEKSVVENASSSAAERPPKENTYNPNLLVAINALHNTSPLSPHTSLSEAEGARRA